MSKKILILGGGFAGVEAAIQMRKRKYEVSLVSDRPFFFIYPISIWVPTHKKNYDDVQLDLAVLAKKHGFKVSSWEVVPLIKGEKWLLRLRLNFERIRSDGGDA